MPKNEKLEYLTDLTLKHTNERRLGAADIVKVILSVVSVLLTVIATLGVGNQGEISLCEHPLQALAKYCTYPLLLACLVFCVHHLHYALNSYHTQMSALVNNAFEHSNDIDEAFEYLRKNNTFDHPWLYKNSLVIIFVLFAASLISILLQTL
jgi:predicted ABC-type transport system involved in lysophospholipase L1 biosynthesis ATPase subunit